MSTDTHHADPITPQTAHLPRLLCLHGGGVTAEIFFLQLRSLRAALAHQFRFVFADGPFFCAPGPGTLPVYAAMGPYRRWLRWMESVHGEVGDEEAVEEVEFKIRECLEEDDARGGKGEWVGIVGFSQGAKVAASMLYESQLRLNQERRTAGRSEVKSSGESKLTNGASAAADGMYGGFDDEEPVITSMNLSDMPEGLGGGKWKFAVILNGRSPLVKLSDLSKDSKTMVGAGEISEGGLEFDITRNTDKLVLPTVHVHGLQDPGIHLHRRLRDAYTEGDAVETVEWDGGHRVPLKKDDTQKVVDATMRAARRAGVLPIG